MLWLDKLRGALARSAGVRLGEAAVVSRRVHTVDPADPRVVSILAGADAGCVFYGREQPDQVIHVDVFHQVGAVDHHRAAAAVKRALAAGGHPALADFFDIQTGTGGGRVTGDLVYGRKPGLLASHRNHIHVAGLLPGEHLGVLVPLVSALEQVVLDQGLEIRRIEGIRHSTGTGGGDLDLSHYADNTDSWLRGAGPRGAGGGHGSLRPAQGAGSGRGTGRDTGTGTAPGEGAAPGQAGADGTVAGGLDALAREEQLQSALALARRLGSPEELKRLFDAVRSGTTGASGLGAGLTQAPYLLRELEDEGLIRRDGRGLRLTEAGRALAAYLDQHLKEVKLRFRKLIRRVPRQVVGARPRAGDYPSPDVRFGPIRGVAPARPDGWVADLAVPETVLAGIRRAHLERLAPGGASSPRTPALRLARADLHVHLRAGEQPLYICLLIDASASMAGRRILAAKHLARHLLVSTRDRVAVVGFQEREVRVHVPFTRDYNLVEDGLTRIQPLGLTPLAHGLNASLELIRASRVRRPLLLLITDGIPTVPKWTVDPLADALEAARRVARSRVPFGCIGLMPSRRYLEELARTAGGTLHVVEELDEDALVSIAHRERVRHRARRG